MEELRLFLYVIVAVVIGCIGYTALNIVLWMAELLFFGV